MNHILTMALTPNEKVKFFNDYNKIRVLIASNHYRNNVTDELLTEKQKDVRKKMILNYVKLFVKKYEHAEGIDLLIEQLDYDLRKADIGNIKNAMYS